MLHFLSSMASIFGCSWPCMRRRRPGQGSRMIPACAPGWTPARAFRPCPCTSRCRGRRCCRLQLARRARSWRCSARAWRRRGHLLLVSGIRVFWQGFAPLFASGRLWCSARAWRGRGHLLLASGLACRQRVARVCSCQESSFSLCCTTCACAPGAHSPPTLRSGRAVGHMLIVVLWYPYDACG